ncbi:MAG: RHS repeat-associated core domain-containing protein, partial [Planctomycetota bacterium]
AGGLRRSRTVRYGNTAFPQGRSTFSYDVYGRLEQIKDDVYTATSTFTTKSQFDYEYDAASNLIKEKYAKVQIGRVGDRFAYDDYHRLSQAWMGVDAARMAGPDPTSFNASQIHEHLTYGLDNANNRTTTSSQTGASPAVTTYTLQGATHAQGASNRYDTVSVPGAPAAVVEEYDERGNMTYDGRFCYRYDFMNRLQEVWRVVPDGGSNGDDEKYAAQGSSLDGAREAVKLEVPDLYSRLAREHTDPVFRARLKATISGGVIRITPTPQGGGGRPGYYPVNGQLVLAAVYVYDAFNRRTLSILVDPEVGETHVHTWDGWRQVVQHKLEYVGGTWVATPTKQFVWGSRLDELVAYRRKVGANWENYDLLHGGQDTAAKLVNASGAVVEQYEYDPYGRVTVYDGAGALVDLGPLGVSPEDGKASAKGLPFLWKSIRLDEITGLLYMRNRYYSVELGRFLTRDRLGVWGDPLNLGGEYGYSGARPLVLGDPFGLQGGLAEAIAIVAGVPGLGQAVLVTAAVIGLGYLFAWTYEAIAESVRRPPPPPPAPKPETPKPDRPPAPSPQPQPEPPPRPTQTDDGYVYEEPCIIVCRGGLCLPESFESGAESRGPGGKLTGVSVNVGTSVPGAVMGSPIRNSMVGVCDMKRIIAAGGQVVQYPGGDPRHHHIDGLTAEELAALFDGSLQPNPNK